MFSIKVDWPLVIGLFLLSVTSLVILWSAGGENPRLIINQSIRLAVAFFVLFAMAQVRPESWYRWAPMIYGAGLFLLVLVFFFGYTGKGAQRWLDLGFMRFQPSEVMKLGVPMMVAWVLARRSMPPSLTNLILALSVLFIPAFLILEQPDLGTTIMIMLSGVVIVFLAGFAWRNIIVLGILGIISLPVLFNFLHPYQQKRIMTLFDPWSDPLGAGYHSIQSMIAIGSGGAQGKGWLQGSQSQLEFIPERHTDFIFSVFSEEFGFVGVFMLLMLYALVTARGLYISYMSKDSFLRLLGGSISMTFIFYVFVNIGMVSGMLPVVGVPLPLISYGGTSMVTLMAGFGILMGIHSHQRLMSH